MFRLEHILFGDLRLVLTPPTYPDGNIALFILLITGIKWRDFLLYCF